MMCIFSLNPCLTPSLWETEVPGGDEAPRYPASRWTSQDSDPALPSDLGKGGVPGRAATSPPHVPRGRLWNSLCCGHLQTQLYGVAVRGNQEVSCTPQSTAFWLCPTWPLPRGSHPVLQGPSHGQTQRRVSGPLPSAAPNALLMGSRVAVVTGTSPEMPPQIVCGLLSTTCHPA